MNYLILAAIAAFWIYVVACCMNDGSPWRGGKIVTGIVLIIIFLLANSDVVARH